MSSGDAIASVIAASAQSVAKVFVIGSVGGLCVVVPKRAPFLPRQLVSSVARFTFHALTIPLIYSTIAIAVSIETVGDYWFLIVGGWIVLALSYAVATLLQCVIRINDQSDFRALRVAATYPNIVALPILIFPSLCEFQVVQEGYARDYVMTDSDNGQQQDEGYAAAAGGGGGGGGGGDEDGDMTAMDLQRKCIAQSTTMIFCYFFAWSLAFWSFGFPQLKNAAAERTKATTATTTNNDHDDHDDNDQGLDDTSVRNTVDVDGMDLAVTTPGITPSPSTESLDRGVEDASGNFDVEYRHGKSPENNHGVALRESTARANCKVQIAALENCEHETTINIEDNGKGAAQTYMENDPTEIRNSTVTLPEKDHPSSSLPEPSSTSRRSSCWKTASGVFGRMWTAIKQTISSPGFIAMLLAFITACIPPLQKALFEPGGPLRFFGSAMETLGQASSPLSTMVVAASLVPPGRETFQSETGEDDQNDGEVEGPSNSPSVDSNANVTARRRSTMIVDERPGMTDPNFGPFQRRRNSDRRSSWTRRSSSHFVGLRRSLRSSSIRILKAVPRSTPDMFRLHCWFILSRLVVTPAVVVGLILGLDCSGSTVLSNVPSLAKLVIIVNSALPGALIVVVLLKSNEEMADTAAAVSKVYLPSYLLSIVTIAAWTAVGLYITILDEDGNTFCQA